MRKFSVSLRMESEEENSVSSRTLMLDGIPREYCKKDYIIRHFQEVTINLDCRPGILILIFRPILTVRLMMFRSPTLLPSSVLSTRSWRQLREPLLSVRIIRGNLVKTWRCLPTPAVSSVLPATAVAAPVSALWSSTGRK